MAWLVAGTVAVLRLPRRWDSPEARLWLTGAWLMVLLNLPLLPASATIRYHALSIMAVLILTAGASALVSLAQRPIARAIIAAAALAALVPFFMTTREIVESLSACGEAMRYGDAERLANPGPPEDIRAWLMEKSRACDEGRFQPIRHAMPSVTWGVGAKQEDASTLTSYRRADGPVVSLIGRDAAPASLTLRAPAATTATPVRVQLRIDERARDLTLSSPDWQAVPLNFTDNIWVRLRGMHRIDLRSTGPEGVEIRTEPPDSRRRLVGERP